MVHGGAHGPHGPFNHGCVWQPALLKSYGRSRKSNYSKNRARADHPRARVELSKEHLTIIRVPTNVKWDLHGSPAAAGM
jgi:hypothetical protein